MTPDDIPWDEFDCLFIGGDDAFKESGLIRRTCREAKRRHKWVHMGRVNSLRRMLIALDFGVDSVDGTYLLHEARKGACRGSHPRCRRLASPDLLRATTKGPARARGPRSPGRADRRLHGLPLLTPTISIERCADTAGVGVNNNPFGVQECPARRRPPVITARRSGPAAISPTSSNRSAVITRPMVRQGRSYFSFNVKCHGVRLDFEESDRGLSQQWILRRRRDLARQPRMAGPSPSQARRGRAALVRLGRRRCLPHGHRFGLLQPFVRWDRGRGRICLDGPIRRPCWNP